MEKMPVFRKAGKIDFTEPGDQLVNELKHGILPFWLRYSVDEKHGGFFGRADNKGRPVPDAHKSLILNTRILWTFSAVCTVLDDPEYLKMADRAWNYLSEYFIDTEFGGAYWLLDYQGVPVDGRKKVYGHAFLIYALAEYYKATGKQTVLDCAIELFDIIETHFFDRENGGYFEAALREWDTTDDMRLSAIDLNEKKSMNAHLHILEAYTNLLRVWDNTLLRQRLFELLNHFRDHIINRDTSQFNLFFNEYWEVKGNRISPGHDIEGSWLLRESADLLGGYEQIEEFHKLAVNQAGAVYEKCLNPDGSLIYEIFPGGKINMERHWWVQAEAMVGFLNAYQLSGDERFYRAMCGVWNYIRENLIDIENGEWFYKRTRDGEVDHNEFKVSEWKGPYHNSRACLELVRRLEQLSKKDSL